MDVKPTYEMLPQMVDVLEKEALRFKQAMAIAEIKLKEQSLRDSEERDRTVADFN